MTETRDTLYRSMELADIVLRLRDDLSFSLRYERDRPVYVVEDSLNAKYYRIGLAEYTFVSLLDGHTTIAEAVGKTAAVMRDEALSETEAAALAQWLVQSELATTSASQSAGRLVEASERATWRRWLSNLRPISPKFPLFHPDHLLRYLTAGFGWIFSIPALVAWLFVMVAALYCVVMNFDQMTQSGSVVLARDNWIWLLLTWLILKVAHETAHGIACQRFGGFVRETGILFILLIPLPYVDVTSAWRFSEKWQRIVTSAAGSYVELFLAAVAAIVWSVTDDPLMKQHAFNAMISAGVMTILFNANPLMRFDGYHILTDWLEMPNLGTRGSQFLMRIGRKYVLGLPASARTSQDGEWIVRVYGVLALIWRVIISCSLIVAAESIFFGAGIVLAAAAVILWGVVPLVRLLRFVAFGSKTEQPSRLRFVAVVLGTTAAVWLLLGFVPWYSTVRAPAVVDYRPLVSIRSAAPGFVSQVHVSDGQHVEAGDRLLTLSNHELAMEVAHLEVQIAETKQRARIYRTTGKLDAFQVSVKNRDALQTRLTEKRSQLAQLVVTAPESGTVVREHPESLLGVYVTPGEQLLTLGDERSKRVWAMVSQEDFEAVSNLTGNRVRVHLWGAGMREMSGIVERVSPRGVTCLRHKALAAPAGGPLSVRLSRPNPSESDASQDSDSPEWELMDPHFETVVALDRTGDFDLSAGQCGYVFFRAYRGRIGHALSDWFRNWRARKLGRSGPC